MTRTLDQLVKGIIPENNLPAVPWAHNLENIFKYFDIYYEKIEIYKKTFPNFTLYETPIDEVTNVFLIKSPFKVLLDFSFSKASSIA